VFENQRIANSASVWKVLPQGQVFLFFVAGMVGGLYPPPCVGMGMRGGGFGGQENADEKFCGRKSPHTMLY